MKRVVPILILLFVVLAGTNISFASSQINVTVNGMALKFDVQPTIVEDRTLVPVRGIFEALGADVSWDAVNKAVIAKKDEISINIPIGKPYALVNNKEIALDVPAQIIEGRTQVPVRFISESFGADVAWINETQTVKIDYDDAGRTYPVSNDNGEIEIEYLEDNGNLPSSMALYNAQGPGPLRYIDYASDYLLSYNDIYLGLIENDELKEFKIFSGDAPEMFISNLEGNKRWATWTVQYNDDTGYYSDIYAYDLLEKETKIIAEGICNGVGGYTYTSTKLDGNRMAWIQSDMEQQKSEIYIYDLISSERSLVTSADFLDDDYFKYPINFLTMKNGRLIYDTEQKSGDLSYITYDIDAAEIVQTIPSPIGTSMNFSGDFDPVNDILAVYLFGWRGSEVGFISLNNGEYIRVFEIYGNDVLRRNRIQIQDGKIFFNIHRDISGEIYDLYQGYIIDLETYRGYVFEGSYELRYSDGYIINLAFDEAEGTNQINCQIFNVEDIFDI